MSEYPVPLDNLIAYVKALHPEGGPLANVSDAFAVSTQLDEQADALIGYFVDQARRSGLSWSQIGGAMGVTKQAAQKRFVPPATKASDLMPASGKPFSQFTARAARTLAAAGKLAAPSPVSSAHLAAALLAEPEGFAAKAIAVAVMEPEQLYAALGTGPAEPAENTGSAELLDLSLDESAKDALKSAMNSALRLGHNYIGTEHFLLGLLSGGGPVAEAFTSRGLTQDRAERLIADELAAYQAFRDRKPAG
ncbi:MAG TPA: Clp protease N-terminal domain-containing protein [Trebonia sp.]|nr:Clp protease N-terminal domain-containing protein [Trebonia sp.]